MAILQRSSKRCIGMSVPRSRGFMRDSRLNEAVNECQAGNSPPDTGGVAAPSRKRCEATAAAQTGWLGLTSFRMRSLEEVPSLTTINASPYRALLLFCVLLL